LYAAAATVVYAVVSPEMGENILVERRKAIGEVVSVVWWPKIFDDTVPEATEPGTTPVRAVDGSTPREHILLKKSRVEAKASEW